MRNCVWSSKGNSNTMKVMKNIICMIVVISTAAGAVRAENNDWENQDLTAMNTEKPHATMVVCPDATTAKSIGVAVNDERVKSPWYRSLNGGWKYHYSPSPQEQGF